MWMSWTVKEEVSSIMFQSSCGLEYISTVQKEEKERTCLRLRWLDLNRRGKGNFEQRCCKSLDSSRPEWKLLGGNPIREGRLDHSTHRHLIVSRSFTILHPGTEYSRPWVRTTASIV